MSELSKTLFGNQHLLAITSAILEGGAGPVQAPGIQAATGLPASTVHRLLQKLDEAGVLCRMEAAGSDRVQRYERRSHPFWGAVRQFARDVEQGRR